MKHEKLVEFSKKTDIEIESPSKYLHIFESSNSLINYAASKNYKLSETEADDLILQFRESVGESKAQPLSDESLDLVSGAGARQPHWS